MSHHIFSTIITLPTGWTDFQYDDKGNVTLVTKPNSDTIEFQYYATGKRAKKIVTAGTTVTTYKYHWDGDLPVRIDKTVGETTTSTYFTFRKPGDIITMTVGEDTYFYVQNIRGDVAALMDSSGNQVASYTYDTWGVPTISNPNNLPNPFLYQGSYATFYDDEFGMYGMGARHYNPATMRFISRDLNHGTLTNTMSQNLYIYCYNNPLGFKDPSGFSPVSCGVAGGIVDTGMPQSMTGGNDGRATPIPNGSSGTKDPKLSEEQQKLWDWCEEQGIKFESKREFLDIWNLAKSVQQDMKKYLNPNATKSNGEKVDYNEFDFEIAFWATYWNNKASLGLTYQGLVTFADQMKALSYLESRCGQDTSAETEGMMGLVDHGQTAKDRGWVSDSLNTQLNVNDDKGVKAGIQASLYAGIAHYLMGISGWNYNNQNYSYWMSLPQETRTKHLEEKNFKLWAGAFCGGCDMAQTAKKNGVGGDNPYGNAANDIVTKGTYTNEHGKKVKLWEKKVP